MLEIPPLSPAYPIIKPGKIKKEDNFSEQPEHKEKQPREDQEIPPAQHIDEIV